VTTPQTTTPTIRAVLYDADGRPCYAPANYTPAPLAPYRAPAAPVPVYQPAPLPMAAPSEQPAYSPLHDPIVVRLLAGGIGLGATALGLSFLLAALAAATTALALLLGVLGLVFLLLHSGGGGGRGAVNVTVNNRMTNRNR
jgi:hypothetical protein